MRRLLLALLMAGLVLMAGSALAADVDCGAFVKGETPSGGTENLCSMTATYTNLNENDTEAELSLGFGMQSRVTLKYIEVRTTNCADCDVTIQTVTGAAAGRIVYFNDGLVAQTIEGTAYTQYLSRLLDVDVIVPTAGGERRLFLRVINNDAEATDDEDVTVFFVWES